MRLPISVFLVALNLDLSPAFVFLSFSVESPFLEFPYQPHWPVIKGNYVWLMVMHLCVVNGNNTKEKTSIG